MLDFQASRWLAEFGFTADEIEALTRGKVV
jgi:hypothetical protein